MCVRLNFDPSNKICGIFMHPLFIEKIPFFHCLDTIKIGWKRKKKCTHLTEYTTYIKNSQRNLFIRSFNIRWKWIFYRYISFFCRKKKHTQFFFFVFDPLFQIRITYLVLFFVPLIEFHKHTHLTREGSEGKKKLDKSNKKALASVLCQILRIAMKIA